MRTWVQRKVSRAWLSNYIPFCSMSYNYLAIPKIPGPWFNIRMPSWYHTSIWNLIVKIKWSYNCLISPIGFLILVRHIYIESGPWFSHQIFVYGTQSILFWNIQKKFHKAHSIGKGMGVSIVSFKLWCIFSRILTKIFPLLTMILTTDWWAMRRLLWAFQRKLMVDAVI